MKQFILISLCLVMAGCTFTYDSRGENALDLSNPKYQNISADKAKIRTGRLVKIKVFHK